MKNMTWLMKMLMLALIISCNSCNKQPTTVTRNIPNDDLVVSQIYNLPPNKKMICSDGCGYPFTVVTRPMNSNDIAETYIVYTYIGTNLYTHIIQESIQ